MRSVCNPACTFPRGEHYLVQRRTRAFLKVSLADGILLRWRSEQRCTLCTLSCSASSPLGAKWHPYPQLQPHTLPLLILQHHDRYPASRAPRSGRAVPVCCRAAGRAYEYIKSTFLQPTHAECYLTQEGDVRTPCKLRHWLQRSSFCAQTGGSTHSLQGCGGGSEVCQPSIWCCTHGCATAVVEERSVLRLMTTCASNPWLPVAVICKRLKQPLTCKDLDGGDAIQVDGKLGCIILVD